MNERLDSQLIMMVAQLPFEAAEMNQFCKLLPVSRLDGVRSDSADFPNDGEIWWMLTAQTARLAVPGQLVVGKIEHALRYEPGNPLSSSFQVVRESIQDLTLSDALEVIELPPGSIENIQDVVERGFHLDLPTPPSRLSMLHWRSKFYGPFVAVRQGLEGVHALETFSFSPANGDGMTVYEIDNPSFANATHGCRVVIQDKVSRTSQNRKQSHSLIDVRHELILSLGYERILNSNPRRLLLEGIDRKLLRFAKRCMTRAKRKQLTQLLDELEITGRETDEAQDLIATVERTRGVVEKQGEALESVTRAMLESGLLGKDRIADAEKRFALSYVQERTAELQAKVEESLTAKRAELRDVEEQLKGRQYTLDKEVAQRRAHLEMELATERTIASAKISAERQQFILDKEEFENQKQELRRQQGLLQQNLEKVTKDLREAGDEVVNRFLTIAPLIKAFELLPQNPNVELPHTPLNSELIDVEAALEIPPFVTGMTVDESPLKEEEFFRRFLTVVDKSGFSFRPLDLQRFHLSVKCGELTVLGGPSGTGKSSLPALYTQALLGEEATRTKRECLMVNINPSWMDTRDLLGHMNTLDGKFYPAESGLFQHLIYAQKEYEIRGSFTGLYFTCLDEMNLSQVEHYFSDLMMVLERSGSARKIRCFSSNLGRNHCQFREWGLLTLSPAIRFVGTVNFDETTRLLSDRLLDRVNLIRLTSGGLPLAGRPGPAFATIGGRMVTLGDIEGWCTDGALPTHLGLLLDQMRPLLTQMGCPISPRVYRGICRFVGSALSIMTPEKGFDIQVAQRLIPKIRSLVTTRQFDALDALSNLFKQSNLCIFDESISLLEEIRETIGDRRWELAE